MKINISWIWLVLIGFLLGILTAFLIQRPEDSTELKAQIEGLKKSIKVAEQKAADLLKENDSVSASLDSLGVLYSDLLSRPITSKQTDSLQKKEISKGRRRYGNEGVKNSQSALASTFGNRAFDELDVLDKRISVQTKVIGVHKGISLTKDSIISTQIKLTKQAQKKATKGKLGSFFAGFGGGALTLALLLLLL